MYQSRWNFELGQGTRRVIDAMLHNALFVRGVNAVEIVMHAVLLIHSALVRLVTECYFEGMDVHKQHPRACL